MTLYYKKNTTIPDLTRGTQYSAGLDLYNAGPKITLLPGQTTIIDCGISVDIPKGYFGHVAIRSGHGFKRNLATHIGVVDADFRGPLKLKVFHHMDIMRYLEFPEGGVHFRGDLYKSEAVVIDAEERIANLVIVPYLSSDPICVEDLSETVRGEQGYGSTGR